jgi:predicted porin
MKCRLLFWFLFTVTISLPAVGQEKQTKKVSDGNFTLLLYMRTIQNANGQWRFDQSIVPNFRLIPWLRMELGIRHGERPDNFLSYNHYKVELQSKYFFKHVRVIARMSEKVQNAPTPTSAITNYLLIAESRFPLSKSFTLLAAGGYVWTRLRDNTTDGLPALSGIKDNYLTYKVGVRYKWDRGGVDLLAGAYDIFNPYDLSNPFLQTSLDYEFSKRTSLYSYYRYQYHKTLDTPANNFVGLGVRLHF